MPDYSKLNQQLAQNMRATIAYTDIRQGYLGKISAADTINPDPTEGLEQGFVWVRFHENGEAIVARCHKISARMPDLPVRVGRDATTKEWTVLEIVPMDVGAINDLASTFSVPDRNDDYIYERFDANRFKSLHVIPGATAFDVEVEPGFYWYHGELKAFSGGTVNISASVPTGGYGGSKRGVLIGIDPSDNTLTTFDGEKLGILETPGNTGKFFTEEYIADTVNDADTAIYWIALIPITSEESDWRDLYRVTALQLAGSTHNFIDLVDAPNSYTGQALKALRVNAGETGVEFYTPSSVSSLNDLSDVTITSPNALDALYYNGSQWVNGDVYVQNTGDTMTGTLNIVVANSSALGLSSGVTLSANDATSYSSSNNLSSLNTGGFNETNPLSMIGYRSFISANGTGGTITGIAGTYTAILKTGTSTLTNGYGHYVETPVKTGGTFTNSYGVYIADQNVATNNYAIYTNAGLNRFGDQVSIIGSANRIQGIVRGYAGQTANLLEIQNDSSTILAKFNKDADLDLTNNVSKTNNDTARFTARNDIAYSTAGFKAPSAAIISEDVTPTVAGVNGLIYGLNLAVSVSGSQDFAGNVYGTQSVVRNQTSGTVTTLIAGLFSAGASASSANAISDNFGVIGALNSYQGGGSNSTITNHYSGYFNTFGSFEKTDVSNLYGVYIGSHTPGTGSSITNQYGLYVANQSAGGTLKYAIYTNGGTVRFGDNVQIADAKNIVLDTTTGTKIGTSSSQKLGLWNAAPAVQPPAYTFSNDSTLRTLDVSAVTLTDLANIVVTMYRDLKTPGFFA